jgi:hypothetical protein
MPVPTPQDMAYAAQVLVGDHNWREGPTGPALAAWLFGRRTRFTHLGMRCTIAWWRGKPYLVGLREAQ